MKTVADISITSRLLQARGPVTPIVITATVSPSLGSLRDGDDVQAALSPGALNPGSYVSTAGAITAVSATVTINGATGALSDVARYGDVVNVSITVSDAAGNTREFTAGTQTVEGIAPTLAAGDSLSGRTLTVSVGSTTGVPAPVTALTALTLDGVDVLGDATGADPWTYEVPDSPETQTVEWTLEAWNVEGSDTASGSEAVAANLFAPTITAAPQITGTTAPGETVTITEATASGPPTPTVTSTLTLGSEDVTSNIAGRDYTIPPETTIGTPLTLTSVASNGIAPDVQNSVSVTVKSAAFEPSQLFMPGDTGVVYDVSDLSSMNTEPDQSGSVPSVGDTVRFLKDKSGNDNNAVSPSLAASPVLRQNANSKYYLEFDGVDDLLLFDGAFVASSLYTMIASFLNPTGSNPIFIHGGSGTSQNTNLSLGYNNGGRIQMGQYLNDLNSSSVDIDALNVVNGSLTPSGKRLRVNGSQVASDTSTAQLISNNDMAIGRVISLFGRLDYYGGVIIDRNLDSDETADVESFYAEKVGIIL